MEWLLDESELAAFFGISDRIRAQMHEMEWLLDESELAAFFGSRGNRIQEFQKRFSNVKVSIDRKEQELQKRFSNVKVSIDRTEQSYITK
ncbi:hypothetical protein T484DRAFT_1788480 [Baffinella frigidus]|nr:hypothetical protein T484DRAFT_1788480 [Cryptophyta sp. CCMP2293]